MTSAPRRRYAADPARRPARALVPWGAFILAVAVLALLIGLGLRSGDEATTSAQPAGDLGMIHVHGLQVDPSDQTLYIGTHNGLFRLGQDGEVERIGERRLDLMGFAIAAPDRFLASGHPSITDEDLLVADRPPLLGLIESRDSGVTWEPLSLLGEADFHALTAAHGSIVGHDAITGRLLVSSDGVSWEERSVLSTPLHSVALSPSDPDLVVGSTAGPVAVSEDGGRSWSLREGPDLVLLSWDHDSGLLWGVDREQRLWSSADAAAWEERGLAPDARSEALLAHEGRLYVATASGIHVSDDAATSWEVLHRIAG